MKSPILFIVGPTGTGKSQIALEVAKQVNGEIVSADSMLIYKFMDIGTAKPSKKDRRQIPHHMIDLISPRRNYSVFDYLKRAQREIAKIKRKNKLPIVVGGTGLYIRSLLEGLEPLPGPNRKLRLKLEKLAKLKGIEYLYLELKKAAPKRAACIKGTDKKRMIRALEICEWRKTAVEGKGIVSLKELGYIPIIIGITRKRADLYHDINQRVEAMFRKGLLRETVRLSKTRLSQTAKQAVGYKEILDKLNNGKIGRKSSIQAKEEIQRNSRRYAKRQWTWFRKEKGIVWMECQDSSRVIEVAAMIISCLKK